jgi:hypothetical protein
MRVGLEWVRVRGLEAKGKISMQQLTADGEQSVRELAQRYRVSVDAVKTLLTAVSAGGGTMAQFYHSELGGGGQWMRGGMTMVGDMFNSGLQATVSGLCSELSSLLGSRQVFVPMNPAPGFAMPGNSWWPAELGVPSSTGGQNDSRYAYFPGSQRLAIERNGQLSVYDTLNHQIGGVQQQQGGYAGSLSFSSQFGTFTVDSLPLVSGVGNASTVAQPTPAPYQNPPLQNFQAPPPATNAQAVTSTPQSQSDILGAIERLGNLHAQGVLSDDEFRSKKAELLSRL